MIPDIQLIIFLEIHAFQGRLSGGEHSFPRTPHTDLGVCAKVALDHLPQAVREVCESIPDPRCIMIPVLIRADVHHTAGNDRVAAFCVFIPEFLREPEGSFRIFAHQVHELRPAVISEPAGRITDTAFQLGDIVRVLVRILIIEQGVSGQIQFRDHIDAQTAAQLAQLSPFFFRILRIPLIILIVEIIIRIDQIRRHARVFYPGFQGRESVALQPVESHMVLHRGADIRIIIVIDMQVVLIDLIPEQHFRIVVKLLQTVRRARHVKHDASYLIRRIVPRDPLWHCAVSVRLVQDLLYSDRSVEAARI